MEQSEVRRHITSVPYKTESLGRLETTSGFDLRRIGDDGSNELFVASGACPKCFGTGQRGIAQREGRYLTYSDWMEAVLTCECGSDHQKEGKTGCGREWTVGAPLDDWKPSDE